MFWKRNEMTEMEQKQNNLDRQGEQKQEAGIPDTLPEPSAVYENVHKVLVVSDSHGRNNNLQKVFQLMKGYMDLVIHLGDLMDSPEQLYDMAGCPVELVRGNCDSAIYKMPLHKLIQVGSHRVLISHGHTLGVKTGTGQLKEAARQMGADVAMYGHTHMPETDMGGDITVVNPGSISMPRQDGHCPTYLVMNLEDDGRTEYNLVRYTGNIRQTGV